MAHPALQDDTAPPMTVEAFMTWDDGTDTRYELIDGRPVAMNPPAIVHSLVTGNLIGSLHGRLKPPCRVFSEAGIRPADRDDSYYQADVIVACAPFWPAGGPGPVPDPVVVFEVLSPSTATHDRGRKVPDYRGLPSVREVVLVSTAAVRLEHWRRDGERWVVTDRIGPETVLELDSVGVHLPLADLYDGVAFDEPASADSDASR